MLSLTEAAKFLSESAHVSYDDSFELARQCAIGLRNPKTEHTARDVAIRMLDSWGKIDKRTYYLWNDLIEAAGLYPYVRPNWLTSSAAIRYEFHKSSYLPEVYFHEEQNALALELLNKRSIVLSAPTSFGKSLLIEELIASRQYSSIVIIQPTLALLDETRKKLHKYRSVYNIIVSTSQKPDKERGNIFLFTAERVVEYRHFVKVDFFIVDEFYKLSLERDDERSLVLNQAFYKLSRLTTLFYMLGPMIKSIPESFIKKFKVHWVRTNFATVAVDEYQIKLPIHKKREERITKQEKLFPLLAELKDPTLIYCSAPGSASELTENFLKFCITNKISSALEKKTLTEELVEWISEYIHEDWVLCKALQNSIAFHHGALPRHLGSSIVDSFNNREIKYLFCTSTLIEGVNTAAKNVILFDKKKGPKPIDYFDYRNIAGRSGRMKIYYTGRVYRFYEEPEQMELDIDVPIITQDSAPTELLLQIDPTDLSAESKKKLAFLAQYDPILLGIIKKNSGLPIEGQLAIVGEIERNLGYFHEGMYWKSFPTYEQLVPVISLAWDNLRRPNENRAGIGSAKQLAYLSISYCSLKSIKGLIMSQIASDYWKKSEPVPETRVNKCVFFTLNLVRHWFDYKLPKLLGAVSNLQNYVFSKYRLPCGDYTFLAGQLENGFVSQTGATLLEYDIPVSAVNKLSKYISLDKPLDGLLEQLRKIDLRRIGLNRYEIRKIKGIL